MEVYTHDLVILGTGLAGLRAALEAAQQSQGALDIALVSKLQLMRAHSVAAEGLTAREIAERLGVRERTVTTHLARIYGKLGVGNRLAALRLAARAGLVSIGPPE